MDIRTPPEVLSTGNGRCALPASPVQGSKYYQQRVLSHPQYREGMADSCGSPLNVQTGSGMNPVFKVHMWQNLNFDSGVHTMAHSQAPSMISMTSIHAGSQISTMSSVADGDRTELTDQQQQKFDNISVSICASQAEYGIAARAIPELLQLMKDTDEAVVYKALYIVQNIAKMDSENQRSRKAVIDGPSVVVALNDVLKERSAFPNIIRVALGALFHICNRPEGLEHVTSVNALCNGQMIRLLVQHVSNVQFSCYKYALLTLHSLLSDRNRGSMSVDVARKINAMQVVSGWLDHEKSEKLLPVIVDLIRILCDRNSEQKTMFLETNGISKLLHILNKCTYENLLWRTIQLLIVFSNFNPLSLVSNGAPTALAHHLTHASERLVLASLECLRNLSDVHSEANYSELLRGLLQLFGHRSLKVVRYTLDILSNMCANNKGNKEFLIANNAIPYLLRVLNEVRVGPHMDAIQAQQIEEIHERILATLCHLCLGHSMASEVQHAIFRMPELFLEKLIDMRPVILRQTLQVLSKAAVQDENLTAFRDLRLEHTCFAQQIIYILRVACNQLATTQWVEDVKVSDLIQFSMLTLQLLCRDKGILNMVVYFLLHADSMKVNDECVLLPVFALHQGYVDEEPLKRCALSLIAAIVQHPEMAVYFHQNHALFNGLQYYARNQNANISKLADEACRLIMLGGVIPKNPLLSYPKSSVDISTSSSTQPSALSSPVQRHVPPLVIKNPLVQPESMEETTAMGYLEPMDGAGEQWPEDHHTISDYPFVSVFCPTNAPQNTPPFSPSLHLPSRHGATLGPFADDLMQGGSPQEMWLAPSSTHSTNSSHMQGAILNSTSNQMNHAPVCQQNIWNQQTAPPMHHTPDYEPYNQQYYPHYNYPNRYSQHPQYDYSRYQ